MVMILQTVNYEEKPTSKYNTFYEEYKKKLDYNGLSIMPLVFCTIIGYYNLF
jgi:hypothetical protein